MDKLFGEYLIRCKVNPKPEAEAPAPEEEEKKAEDAVDPDMPEGVVAETVEEEPFYPYEKISIEDALIRTHIAHVAVLFTAEYCPPCHGFM